MSIRAGERLLAGNRRRAEGGAGAEAETEVEAMTVTVTVTETETESESESETESETESESESETVRRCVLPGVSSALRSGLLPRTSKHPRQRTTAVTGLSTVGA
jgi:hypothetical protein